MTLTMDELKAPYTVGADETLIDAWIDRVVSNHGKSDTYLKYACIAAAQVVGSYSGATGVIAKRANRHPSSVENWAHAFRLYKELRTQASKPAFYVIRKLWRTLPASHWWLAYDIQLSGFDSFYYLNNAALHSWSARDMMREYKQDREGGSAPLVFKHACLSFYGLANELSKRNELNAEQKAAIKAVQKAFQIEEVRKEFSL